MTEEQSQELRKYCGQFFQNPADAEQAFQLVKVRMERDRSVPSDPDQFMEFAKITARMVCLTQSEELNRDGKDPSMGDFIPNFEKVAKEAAKYKEGTEGEKTSGKESSEEQEKKASFWSAAAAVAAAGCGLAVLLWKLIKRFQKD